jgi:hypothetical protein
MAAPATTAPAPRAQKALCPAAPPFDFGLLTPAVEYKGGSDVSNEGGPEVGYKGGRTLVTATVAPEVRVGAWKIESGLPVDEMPVGEAVTETASSTMPNAEQALAKPVQCTFSYRRTQ